MRTTTLRAGPDGAENTYDAAMIRAIRSVPRLRGVAIVGIAEVVAPYTTPHSDLRHTRDLFVAKGFDDVIAKVSCLYVPLHFTRILLTV